MADGKARKAPRESQAQIEERTALARLQGQRQLQAARAQGRDEKRWFTARDELVDGGAASGACIDAAAEGWISIDQPFINGHDTYPAHVGCRCDVETRTRRLQ